MYLPSIVEFLNYSGIILTVGQLANAVQHKIDNLFPNGGLRLIYTQQN